MAFKPMRFFILLGVLLPATFGFLGAEEFKPGNKGKIPLDPQGTPVPPARKIVNQANRDAFNIPPNENNLKCGEPFHIWVVAKQKVESCESFKSYRFLLKQAMSDRNDSEYVVHCPDDCKNRFTWFSKCIFTCENNVAMVKIKENVKCFKPEGDTVPPYIDSPFAQDLKKPVTVGPDDDEFKSAYNGEYIEDEFVSPEAVPFGLS